MVRSCGGVSESTVQESNLFTGSIKVCFKMRAKLNLSVETAEKGIVLRKRDVSWRNSRGHSTTGGWRNRSCELRGRSHARKVVKWGMHQMKNFGQLEREQKSTGVVKRKREEKVM